LNLYNESESDSTYQAVHKSPGKYERKSKWLSAKQVDRLGKSFGIMGFMISKKTEPPVIIDSTKLKNQFYDSIIIILIMVF
jgi:hypothetical protein